MSKVITFLSSSLVLALPIVAGAATTAGDNIVDLIGAIETIVNNLVGVLMTLAVLAFFWGLVLYIFNAGDEAKRKSGRGIMIWGVVALFVMVSIWGLVNFIGDAFGVDQTEAEVTPSELNPNL